MNIIIKIVNGSETVDFQCIDVDSAVNSAADINTITEKVFLEYRETFQEN